MEQHAEGRDLGRRDQDGRSLEIDAHGGGAGAAVVDGQFRPQHRREVRALPVGVRQQRMRPREAREALDQAAPVALDVAGLPRREGGERLHRRQGVLHPVVQLLQHEVLLPVGLGPGRGRPGQHGADLVHLADRRDRGRRAGGTTRIQHGAEGRETPHRTGETPAQEPGGEDRSAHQKHEAQRACARHPAQRQFHVFRRRAGDDRPSRYRRPARREEDLPTVPIQRVAGQLAGGGGKPVRDGGALSDRFRMRPRPRDDDALAVDQGADPARPHVDAGQDRSQPLGRDAEMQQVGDALFGVAHRHGDREAVASPGDADKMVRDDRGGRAAQPRIPGREARPGGERLSPGDQAVDDLASRRRVAQEGRHAERPVEAGGLLMKGLQVAGRQRRRDGERLHGLDQAGQLALDHGGDGLRGGRHIRFEAGALRGDEPLAEEAGEEEHGGEHRADEQQDIEPDRQARHAGRLRFREHGAQGAGLSAKGQHRRRYLIDWPVARLFHPRFRSQGGA